MAQRRLISCGLDGLTVVLCAENRAVVVYTYWSPAYYEEEYCGPAQSTGALVRARKSYRSVDRNIWLLIDSRIVVRPGCSIEATAHEIGKLAYSRISREFSGEGGDAVKLKSITEGRLS